MFYVQTDFLEYPKASQGRGVYKSRKLEVSNEEDILVFLPVLLSCFLSWSCFSFHPQARYPVRKASEFSWLKNCTSILWSGGSGTGAEQGG